MTSQPLNLTLAAAGINKHDEHALAPSRCAQNKHFISKTQAYRGGVYNVLWSNILIISLSFTHSISFTLT